MFTIELPLPPALNHAYRASVSRAGRPYTYKTTHAKRWQEDAVLVINAARKSKVSYLQPVRVVVRLFLKHDRDIDSSFKLLLDTLQMSGLLMNDRQIHQIEASKVKSDSDKVEIDVISLDSTK